MRRYKESLHLLFLFLYFFFLSIYYIYYNYNNKNNKIKGLNLFCYNLLIFNHLEVKSNILLLLLLLLYFTSHIIEYQVYNKNMVTNCYFCYRLVCVNKKRLKHKISLKIFC